MFRLLGFLVRTIIKLKIVLLAVAGGMAFAYGLQAREQSRTWGLLPGDADRPLPGDDLVARPDHVDTRSLLIDVPPAAVWPWLVQMGHGRGGWYGYGVLDRSWSPIGAAAGRSAESILPQFQDLSAGDVVPTHKGGGFVARIVEADHALVLYLDDGIVREQTQALADEGSEGAARVVTEMQDMPAFVLSWAFMLEPEAGGRSRLVERIRMHMEMSGPQRRGVPFLGLGAFALMRSQMLGIKRRAESGTPSAA